MPERITVPTMGQMLQGIEPRIVLGLSLEVEDNPEELEQQAAAALREGSLSFDILRPLQAYVRSEQHKRNPRSREEIQRDVACVVLAHVWQAENETARQQRKKLPH